MMANKADKKPVTNKKNKESKVGAFVNKHGQALINVMIGYMVVMYTLLFISFDPDKIRPWLDDSPGTPPQVTEEPATAEPGTTEPDITSAPVTPEPVTPEPVTPEPVTEEPDTDVADSPTEQPQPSEGTATVWINLETLALRDEPDLYSGVLGAVPYGEEITGELTGRWQDAQNNPDALAWEVCDKWLHITYQGIDGYLFMGNTLSGRACVVYSQADLEPLE
ncbi:MAG: hypothetical protein JXN65_02045 [Clostridia bacterium]|nr:hypothetical protein [Clostridia bacterium]